MSIWGSPVYLGRTGTGGIIVSKTITQNGVYDASSEGADGYSPVTVNVGSEVPPEYTRVPYIQSDGTQFIDTGISAPNGAKVVGNLCFVSALVQYDTICGTQSSGGTSPDRNAQIMRNAATSSYSVWSGTSYSATTLSISYDTLIDIIADNRSSAYNLVLSNGQYTKVYTTSTSSGRNSGNLFLFALNDGGTAGYFAAAKINWLEIIDNNGDIVRSYFAARRNSDGVLGLWDAISQSFFTNDGTGSFTTYGGTP